MALCIIFDVSPRGGLRFANPPLRAVVQFVLPVDETASVPQAGPVPVP